MATLIFETVKAMQEWGKRLARLLETGDVVALVGDLGSGKTTMTQGIAEGWGARERANSPTFALVNEYRSKRGILQHMDVYRLSEKELDQFPLEDYLNDESVTVIEWADRVRKRWPKNTLEIRFVSPTATTRQITILFPRSWDQPRRTEMLIGQHE
jgi:tRNA threonylcarbamoyladenosine biosynthesis protein TsaE